MREATFSLRSAAFGQSVLIGARREVGLHCKGYALVPVFLEFLQLREVRVFCYLFYSLAKSHFNGWGYLEAWMAVFSIPKIGIE